MSWMSPHSGGMPPATSLCSIKWRVMLSFLHIQIKCSCFVMYTDELKFHLWSRRGECEWDQQIKKFSLVPSLLGYNPQFLD